MWSLSLLSCPPCRCGCVVRRLNTVIHGWFRMDEEHIVGSGFIGCIAHVAVLAKLLLDVFQLFAL